MGHEHIVKDSDAHFKIDPTTMAISCSSAVKALKKGDHASEIYSFSMPRYIEGHDMSLCNKVEIHYNNAKYDRDSRTTITNKSFCEANDFGISADDENVVTWSWQITGDATQLDGTLGFCIRFACLSGETIDYQKFSATYNSIQVGDTIYNTEHVALEYADILEAWRQELIQSIENCGGVKTVNGVAPDENGNVQIQVQADEVISEDEIIVLFEAIK